MLHSRSATTGPASTSPASLAGSNFSVPASVSWFEGIPKFCDCADETRGTNHFLSADFEGDSAFGLLSFFAPESLESFADSPLPSESDFEAPPPAGFFA